MKCLHLTPAWRKKATLLSLLFIILQTVQAQDSIVAYSDTVSILADVADDSLWNQSAVPPFSGFDDWEITEDNGMLDFMAHVFGLTGGILLLLTILIFLFPILVIALIIYLIYRLNRGKKRNDAPAGTGTAPLDEATRNTLRRQSAIRNACWGVGLIVMEWAVGLTSLLYVGGIILLCIAAGDWLSTLIRKKND